MLGSVPQLDHGHLGRGVDAVHGAVLAAAQLHHHQAVPHHAPLLTGGANIFLDRKYFPRYSHICLEAHLDPPGALLPPPGRQPPGEDSAGAGAALPEGGSKVAPPPGHGNMVPTLSSVSTLVSAVPPLAHAAAAAQVPALQTEEHGLEQGEEAPVQQLGHQVPLLCSASSGHLPHVKRVLSLTFVSILRYMTRFVVLVGDSSSVCSLAADRSNQFSTYATVPMCTIATHPLKVPVV